MIRRDEEGLTDFATTLGLVTAITHFRNQSERTNETERENVNDTS